MKEAELVQKLILSIQPKPSETVPSTTKSKSTGNKRKDGKAASASSSSPPVSTPSTDPNVPWSKPSIDALATSADPKSHLVLALLYDPASTWHPHLRDATKSIQQYGLAAIKMPSAYACARLAHLYLTGDKIPGGKDMVKGMKWLRVGASKGHVLCQYQLGYLLEEGGVDGQQQPDFKGAAEMYEKAAAQKYPSAMTNLGMMLMSEDSEHPGVSQDVYRGIRLLEDAASLGESRAQLKLGHLCFLGDADMEIDASIPRCIHYLTLAAHNEEDPSPDAAKILGIIYSTPDTNSMHNPHYDLAKSIRYLRMAAESGDADAKTLLHRQMAKYNKIQKGMVVDSTSAHAEAMRLLSLQEGKAIQPVMASVVDESNGSVTAAAGSDETERLPDNADIAAATLPLVTTTPSSDALLLALTRLHSRYPHYGASKLHAATKSEYPHWELSEKRVKKVMKQQGWSAENTNAAATTKPIPAIVLAHSSNTKQRINENVVDDLD